MELDEQGCQLADHFLCASARILIARLAEWRGNLLDQAALSIGDHAEALEVSGLDTELAQA